LGNNRKPACDFLLVNNINLILSRTVLSSVRLSICASARPSVTLVIHSMILQTLLKAHSTFLNRIGKLCGLTSPLSSIFRHIRTWQIRKGRGDARSKGNIWYSHCTPMRICPFDPPTIYFCVVESR